MTSMGGLYLFTLCITLAGIAVWTAMEVGAVKKHVKRLEDRVASLESITYADE